MWNKLLAFNSFIIWPATGIFLVYTIGRALLHGDWFLLGVGLALFGIAIVVQTILAALSE